MSVKHRDANSALPGEFEHGARPPGDWGDQGGEKVDPAIEADLKNENTNELTNEPEANADADAGALSLAGAGAGAAAGVGDTSADAESDAKIGDTSSASDSAADAVARAGDNTNTIEISVLDGVTELLPDDNDLIDIDQGVGFDEMLTAAYGSELSYDPGNDVDLSGILKGALDGAGQDVGQVFVGTNTLEDNDVLTAPTWNSEGAVTFTPTAGGGTATTGPGMAPAGALAGDLDLIPVTVQVDTDGGGGQSAGGDSTSADVGNWGSGMGDDEVEVEVEAESGSWMDHMSVALNQDVVMGANVLGNAIDTTVVGGDMTMDYDIDEA